MSLGNLNTQGGKGTNYPWQSKLLQGIQSLMDTNSSVLTNIEALLESQVRTPGYNYIGPGNNGTIAPGFRSYSIHNIGSTDALVNGNILPAGLEVEFSAGALEDVLAGISYDSQLSTLVITTVL